jgi:hypothetical protein
MGKVSIIFLVVSSSLGLAWAQDTSCGIIWDPPIQLSESTYWAISPKIALSGDDTVHVTFAPDYHCPYKVPYVRSIDGGVSWTGVQDLITDTISYPDFFFRNLLATEGQNVFVFAANEPNVPKKMTLTISTNAGSSWGPTRRIGPDTVAALFSANVFSDTLDVVYDRFRQIVSTDGGITWARTGIVGQDIYARSVLTSGTLHLTYNIQVGNAQEKLYMRSFDLGQTWQDAETLSTIDGRSAVEAAMASSDSMVYVAWRDGVACAAFVGCTVIGRQTLNNGEGWSAPLSLTDIPRGYDPAVAVNEHRVVALVWSDEVVSNAIIHVVSRVSRDHGQTWSPIYDLTPTDSIVDLPTLAISSNAIHVVWSQLVGGNNGTFRIFYRRGRFLTNEVDDRQQELPTTTYLMQNYPNPFNTTTVMSYELRVKSWVRLVVYDLLGREVATLITGMQDAGYRSVQWDGSGMPSGVYYYRLTAGNGAETKKALLIR